MEVHDELADQAAAYALGTLTYGERADFEAHLASCRACAAEVHSFALAIGVLAASPQERQRGRWVGGIGDIGSECRGIDAHPIAATIGIVINAFKANNIIEAGAHRGIDAGQTELRGREIRTQISRVDDDLSLDQHAIEIDFDTVAGISICRSLIQIIRIEGDS